MSPMLGPPADQGAVGSAPGPLTAIDPPAGEGRDAPGGRGAIRAPDRLLPEPYQRPNPLTVEDADELHASVERVIRRAGRHFREEQQRLVEAGIIDGEGRLLRGAPPHDAAAAAGDDDR